MEHSIWIIPPKPLYSELKSVINSLAEEYIGPIFEPHMTILGNIPKDVSAIEESLRKVASKQERLDLSLETVSFSTTYYQSVFVRVNPTSALMDLNLELKKVFNLKNDVFMPHISLLYGEYDMETREKIAANIKIQPSHFSVKECVITPFSHNPSEWTHQVTIPFESTIITKVSS